MQLKLVVWFICSVFFFWKDKGRFLQRLPVVLHMNVLHQMQNMSYWKYDVVRIVHHKVSAHHHSFYDKAIISFTVIWCWSHILEVKEVWGRWLFLKTKNYFTQIFLQTTCHNFHKPMSTTRLFSEHVLWKIACLMNN